MTKILCVGDLHVTDKAPVSATESYTDDIIAMLYWIADYAAEEGVDAVVLAGDVFHHKAPSRNSHELVLKMIAVVKYFLSKGLLLLCVTGNHDVQNGRTEDVHERQPLGVLYEAGLVELNGWHETLPLFGVPWRESWTEPGDPALALRGREDSEGFGPVNPKGETLVVTHAPIYPPDEAQKQMFELVQLAGEGGLSEAMGNEGFLYYGHIHEDHGIFEVEGVTYANMGALSRGSLHEYNLNRTIKVALWDTSGPYPQFTEVPVPHKPASEVFRIAEVMEERGQKLSLESFLSAVGSRTLEISDTGSVIEHIQGRTDVNARVKKKAVEILEDVS